MLMFLTVNSPFFTGPKFVKSTLLILIVISQNVFYVDYMDRPTDMYLAEMSVDALFRRPTE